MDESNGLHAFLRSKAATAAQAEPEVDWQARKDKWLAHLARLHDLVRTWLEPLHHDGTVRCSTSHVTLEEDYIGAYQADVLTLVIGKQRVAFHPKGTLIVGADGRVDVRGQRAVRTIVLKGDGWFVVAQSPHLKTLPFNEDSFQDVLQEVMA